MDILERASCHEAGHIVVSRHFNREVLSAGVREGKPQIVSFLEPAGSAADATCWLILAGGVAGETLKEPNTPYDPDGFANDQRQISERGGLDITEYLTDAASIVQTHEVAWTRLTEIYLKEFRAAHKNGWRDREFLSQAQIDAVWDHCETPTS